MSPDLPSSEVDLTPATTQPRDVLHDLRLTVGLAELHAAINQHRTERGSDVRTEADR